VLEAVFLRDNHVDYLAPPGHEVAKGHAAGFDVWGLGRPHDAANLHNHQRVDAVGLG
jgi:hypothetical protein